MKTTILLSLVAAILGAVALYAFSASSGDETSLLSSLRRNLQDASSQASRNMYAQYPFPTGPVNEPRTNPPIPSTPLPLTNAPVAIPVTSAPIAPAPTTSAPVAPPTTNAPVLPPTPLATNAPVLPPTTSAPVMPPIPPSPSLPLELAGNNGYPATTFPLAKCQGDCDFDSECAYGLICYQRDYANAVPGCSGTPQSNMDYCIDPADISKSVALPGEATAGFGLKLYWQSGYLWQDQPFDIMWCAKCDDMVPECYAGQGVYVTECETNTTAWEPTEWQFVYLPSKAFYIKIASSNMCLTLPTDINLPLTVEQCSPYNEYQLFFALNGQVAWNDKFELHPVRAYDRCLDITHHPKLGERILAWPCAWPRAWTTNFWNIYNLTSES